MNDVGQAQWIAGADFLAHERVTLGTDFLGFHDDKRDGLNDDVVQAVFGLKVNVYGRAVVTGNVQLSFR